MEDRSNYEKKSKILEDNIIRLMMERNLSAWALGKKIWMNDWYITRMLNGKIDDYPFEMIYDFLFGDEVGEP